jgi:cytochrome-b5 reductase
MDYHPGGWDELMKGAGKDATDLFNEVHRWVNYESMLEACLVGKLDEERPKPSPDPKKSSAGFAMPKSLSSSKPGASNANRVNGRKLFISS